jgi:hypothetical protein
MAQWRIKRDEPRLLRLQSDSRYRGIGMLAFGGVLIAIFLLALLGWIGVLEIAHDLGGLLGTVVPLALGVVVLYAGARARWGWCELELADVAITVVDGFGWRILHSARIVRPAPGVPLTVVVERDGGGDTPPVYWLSVHNGEPYGPIAIARGLSLSRSALEEVAAVLERWGLERQGRDRVR